MKDMEKEIVRVALVGTQRAGLSVDAKVIADEWELKDLSDEETVLATASILFRMKKTAFQTVDFRISNNEIPPKNSKKVCNTTAIKLLNMIMDGAFENALPEFLFHLEKNNKCLPPEILPGLLERSLSSPHLWEQLKKNIGERGKWLLRQNDDWSSLRADELPEDWEEALHDQRLMILEKTRRNDPAKAIRMLEETWPRESVNQKVRFLKVLEKTPTKDLESFLEQCLDDRRKEVRKSAVRLLAKISNSSLSERMFERMKDLIHIKSRTNKKEKLEIRLPDKLDDAMIRDGIDPRVQWYKGGVKASRLGQMVALIQPAKWLEYLNLPAGDVVDMFVRSDWGELLIQAMVEATALHNDNEWTKALLLFRITSSDRKRWQNLNVSRLIDDVSDDVFNAVAIEGMKKQKGYWKKILPSHNYSNRVPACGKMSLPYLSSKTFRNGWPGKIPDIGTDGITEPY